jgi:hypothetical protein
MLQTTRPTLAMTLIDFAYLWMPGASFSSIMPHDIVDAEKKHWVKSPFQKSLNLRIGSGK